jgi:hypothetical protein
VGLGAGCAGGFPQLRPSNGNGREQEFGVTPKRSYITSDIDFERDGKQIARLRLPYSRNTSGWGIIPIPIAVVRNGAGPTVLFTAGNHGDEYEGQITLNNLIRTLEPRHIKGRVIILPAMNYPAASRDADFAACESIAGRSKSGSQRKTSNSRQQVPRDGHPHRRRRGRADEPAAEARVRSLPQWAPPDSWTIAGELLGPGSGPAEATMRSHCRPTVSCSTIMRILRSGRLDGELMRSRSPPAGALTGATTSPSTVNLGKPLWSNPEVRVPGPHRVVASGSGETTGSVSSSDLPPPAPDTVPAPAPLAESPSCLRLPGAGGGSCARGDTRSSRRRTRPRPGPVPRAFAPPRRSP